MPCAFNIVLLQINTLTVLFFLRHMKQRKDYKTPATEVVELEMQGSLLAGSGEQNGSVEDGKLNGFDEDWE